MNRISTKAIESCLWFNSLRLHCCSHFSYPYKQGFQRFLAMSATTIQIDDYAMTEEANQLKLVLYFSDGTSQT